MSIRKNLDRLGTWDYGTWFHLPVSFLHIMRPDEAIVLAFAINIYCLKVRTGNHKDGWVSFSTPLILKHIPLHKDTVIRILKTLKKMDLIRIRVEGMPAKRMLYVDASAVWEKTRKVEQNQATDDLLLQATDETRLLATEERRGVIYTTTIKKNNTGELFTVKSIRKSANWVVLAQQLRDAIPRKVPNGQTAKSWAPHFKEIHTKDGYSVEEIRQVLDWYCDVMRREGMQIVGPNPNLYHQAFSGTSFQKKFSVMRDRMVRDYSKEGRALPKEHKPERLYHIKSIRKKREMTSEEWNKFVVS